MGDANNLKGEQGFIVLDAAGTDQTYTTDEPKAYITGISFIEDTTFSALTCPKGVNSDDLIGKTFLAGSFYPIEASLITVDSGSCMGLFHENQ
jgi:hypothetical protein